MEMYFSQGFFNVLIKAALVLMGGAAISLIIMVIRDIKSDELW